MIINPGTEDINSSSVENAIENIKHFVTDLNNEKVEIIRYEEHDYEKEYKGNGRYCFLLKKGNYCHEIQMPGLPLEKVRWMSREQNIFAFPRLYVDDSSWIWGIALGICDFEDKEGNK